MADAVLIILKRTPVNVVPLAFQVCEASITGADAVTVPLSADSVVKAPEFLVVEPIGVF